MAYIDPVKASPDNCKLLFENEHVKVLEMNLKAGTTDNEHSHRAETVYFISGGSAKDLRFLTVDNFGTTTWTGGTMSGSGATCFGLFENSIDAEAAAGIVRRSEPDWWIEATAMNDA